MITAATVEVRAHLADHLYAVQTDGTCVVLTRHGRRVAALVPIGLFDMAIAVERAAGTDPAAVETPPTRSPST